MARVPRDEIVGISHSAQLEKESRSDIGHDRAETFSLPEGAEALSNKEEALLTVSMARDWRKVHS